MPGAGRALGADCMPGAGRSGDAVLISVATCAITTPRPGVTARHMIHCTAWWAYGLSALMTGTEDPGAEREHRGSRPARSWRWRSSRRPRICGTGALKYYGSGGGHVDHGPLVLGGGGEDLVGATAQDRITVVGVFPVAVGVADDQFQGPVRAGRGPLEHGQVAVGVPGRHDRALPDVLVNRAGLLRPVVDDPDFGAFDEFGAALADAEFGFAYAADHPVRGQAVAVGCPRPHEVRAATGDDPAGEPITVQQAEQLQHRLVHRRRVRAAETRVPG